MSNFKISAFADEYATPFEDQLKGMQRLGIQWIELRHLSGKNISTLSAKEVTEAKKCMEHYGIRASAIGSPLGKIPLDGDLHAHTETAKRVFEAASIMETPFVRVFSFYAPEGGCITDMEGEVLQGMEQMLRAAEVQGVTLCHENEARIYGDTPARCRRLLDHFGGALRCVFDMGNFVLEDVDPYPDAYELLKEYISYFHIKDALREGAIVPAGKGDAKIREILCAHREYAEGDFFVSLEPHLQTFSGRNSLVGRSFKNPYQYPDPSSAFEDAVTKFKELF